ncbi:hypothetical protein B0H13DRAFT_2528832 [Mycena leptocephala]|nr:hypothetical protein B0H13DRAFT_2528832 [Mycena leptocephala]
MDLVSSFSAAHSSALCSLAIAAPEMEFIFVNEVFSRWAAWTATKSAGRLFNCLGFHSCVPLLSHLPQQAKLATVLRPGRLSGSNPALELPGLCCLSAGSYEEQACVCPLHAGGCPSIAGAPRTGPPARQQVSNAFATTSSATWPVCDARKSLRRTVRGRIWGAPLLCSLRLPAPNAHLAVYLLVPHVSSKCAFIHQIIPMPEAFPTVLDSPSNSDSRSLSKFTSYSYADEDADATLDVTSFSADGFSEFTLDLTCLSRPPSPPPSPPPPSDLPFASYLPSSPPESSRRSVSFSTGPSPSLGRAASAPRLSTSPRISLTSAPGANTLPASGSWPLSRYLGRGTPIDRGRASEWSGGKPEGGANGEDVAEDGVLFSTVRSTSIDSTPQPSQRSISPLAEWNYISPPPLVYTPYSARRRSTVSLGVEPLPESVKIQLKGIDPNSSAEWASSTQQVLASPISAASTSTSTPELSSETETQFESAMQSAEELQLRTPDADEHERGGAAAIERDMERERVRAREMDLGLETLHAAVDQGWASFPAG